MDTIGNTSHTKEVMSAFSALGDAHLVPVTLTAGRVEAQATGEQRVSIRVPTVQVAVNPMAVPLALMDTIGNTTHTKKVMIVHSVQGDADLVPVTLTAGRVVVQATGEHRARILVTTV